MQLLLSSCTVWLVVMTPAGSAAAWGPAHHDTSGNSSSIRKAQYFEAWWVPPGCKGFKGSCTAVKFACVTSVVKCRTVVQLVKSLLHVYRIQVVLLLLLPKTQVPFNGRLYAA